MYFIFQGAVQIDVSNGKESSFLDLLGRGSILGANFVLSRNEWGYSATCKSVMSTVALLISKKTLLRLAVNSDFRVELEKHQS